MTTIYSVLFVPVEPFDSLLPNYAKAFDICLNPFVLTREGKHLSPTKTLEYLATGKPVVSTPITDIVRFYDGVVNIADGVEEFEMAVKRCIEEDNELLKQKRVAFTEGKTWKNTVRKMEELILEKMRYASFENRVRDIKHLQKF